MIDHRSERSRDERQTAVKVAPARGSSQGPERVSSSSFVSSSSSARAGEARLPTRFPATARLVLSRLIVERTRATRLATIISSGSLQAAAATCSAAATIATKRTTPSEPRKPSRGEACPVLYNDALRIEPEFISSQ
ncbi:unnamed protein product [Lampetra fluviatilis]